MIKALFISTLISFGGGVSEVYRDTNSMRHCDELAMARTSARVEKNTLSNGVVEYTDRVELGLGSGFRIVIKCVPMERGMSRDE